MGTGWCRARLANSQHEGREAPRRGTEAEGVAELVRSTTADPSTRSIIANWKYRAGDIVICNMRLARGAIFLFFVVLCGSSCSPWLPHSSSPAMECRH